ncbi:MAG: histidine kinase dimerization/phospho-acceptor domain-containing protein [Bacteriovoracaceae bacterium]
MQTEAFLLNSPRSLKEKVGSFSTNSCLIFCCDYEIEKLIKEENSQKLFVILDLRKVNLSKFDVDYIKVDVLDSKNLEAIAHEIEFWLSREQVNTWLLNQLEFNYKDDLEVFFDSLRNDDSFSKLILEEFSKLMGPTNTSSNLHLNENAFSGEFSSLKLSESLNTQRLHFPSVKEKRVFEHKENHSREVKAISYLWWCLINDQKNHPKKFELPEEFQEIACCIVEDHKNLIYSNLYFNQLSIPLSELETLQNEQVIKLSGFYYLFKRYEKSNFKEQLLTLERLTKDQYDSMMESSNEELGIVCSSIAHELNNPIGGILNSIQVLEILESFAADEVELLKEMKDSMNRCRDLVELFLGFVKKNIQSKEDVNIENGIEKALELLRPRMINDGLHLSVRIEGPQSSIHNVNHAVMVIIFYLILSEILTKASRRDLINEGIKTHGLELKAKLEEQNLIFEYQGLEQFDLEIGDSSLFRYLLNSQRLKFDFKGDRMTLYA